MPQPRLRHSQLQKQKQKQQQKEQQKPVPSSKPELGMPVAQPARSAAAKAQPEQQQGAPLQGQANQEPAAALPPALSPADMQAGLVQPQRLDQANTSGAAQAILGAVKPQTDLDAAFKAQATQQQAQQQQLLQPGPGATPTCSPYTSLQPAVPAGLEAGPSPGATAREAAAAAIAAASGIQPAAAAWVNGSSASECQLHRQHQRCQSVRLHPDAGLSEGPEAGNGAGEGGFDSEQDLEYCRHEPGSRSAKRLRTDDDDGEGDDDEYEAARLPLDSKARTRERNRIAARKCRARKMEALSEARERVGQLASRNEELRIQLVALQKMFSREVQLREALKAILDVRWTSASQVPPGTTANDVLVALESGTLDMNALLQALSGPPAQQHVAALHEPQQSQLQQQLAQLGQLGPGLATMPSGQPDVLPLATPEIASGPLGAYQALVQQQAGFVGLGQQQQQPIDAAAAASEAARLHSAADAVLLEEAEHVLQLGEAAGLVPAGDTTAALLLGALDQLMSHPPAAAGGSSAPRQAAAPQAVPARGAAPARPQLLSPVTPARAQAAEALACLAAGSSDAAPAAAAGGQPGVGPPIAAAERLERAAGQALQCPGSSAQHVPASLVQQQSLQAAGPPAGPTPLAATVPAAGLASAGEAAAPPGRSSLLAQLQAELPPVQPPPAALVAGAAAASAGQQVPPVGAAGPAPIQPLRTGSAPEEAAAAAMSSSKQARQLRRAASAGRAADFDGGGAAAPSRSASACQALLQVQVQERVSSMHTVPSLELLQRLSSLDALLAAAMGEELLEAGQGL